MERKVNHKDLGSQVITNGISLFSSFSLIYSRLDIEEAGNLETFNGTDGKAPLSKCLLFVAKAQKVVRLADKTL